MNSTIAWKAMDHHQKDMSKKIFKIITTEGTNFSLSDKHLAVLRDQYNARNQGGVDFRL
jgi:hypothetical protein